MSKDPSSQTPKAPEAGEVTFNLEVTKARYRKWFPELTPDTVEKLCTFTSELLKFNKTVNLIPSSTIRNADAVHIGDAVLACRLILPRMHPDAPLYDLGSGNGVPGVVFGILYPQLKVVLVDRDQRKLEFCKHIITVLRLTNVTLQAMAIEDLPERSIQNAVTRGLASLQKSMLLARKSVSKGGRFFHMKGDGWANELSQVPSQLFSFWSPSLLGQFRIPETSNEAAVVLTDKISD